MWCNIAKTIERQKVYLETQMLKFNFAEVHDFTLGFPKQVLDEKQELHSLHEYNLHRFVAFYYDQESSTRILHLLNEKQRQQ